MYPFQIEVSKKIIRKVIFELSYFGSFYLPNHCAFPLREGHKKRSMIGSCQKAHWINQLQHGFLKPRHKNLIYFTISILFLKRDHGFGIKWKVFLFSWFNNNNNDTNNNLFLLSKETFLNETNLESFHASNACHDRAFK